MNPHGIIHEAGMPETSHPRVRSGNEGGFVGTVLALMMILALATGLRLHGLGGHGLWQDEAYTVAFATMPTGKFWKVMWSREGNMLLYYVLMRAWIHVGASEFVLRLPSAMFAIASVGLIYRLGKQLFGKRAGLIAAVLLSVHMLDIFSSQNARGYTLAVLLLIASSSAFTALLRFPERKLYQVAYPLLSALSVYAQLLALLAVLSQWLSLNRAQLRAIGWRRWLRIVGTFFLFALPMEAFAVLKNKGQLSWIPPLNFHTFRDGMYAITGYGGWLLLALYAALILITVIRALRKGDGEDRFAVRLLAMWLAFPVLAMVLYSFHKPLFYSRFLILCVPAAILLAAQGMAACKYSPGWRGWLWLPALAAVVGMSVRSDWRYFESGMWPDWKDATHLVLAGARPHDAICFSGNGAEVFLYYMQREQQIGWNALPNSYYSQGVRCLGKPPEQMAQTNSGYQRAWLLKTDGTEEQYEWILRMLATQFGPPTLEGIFPSPPGRIVVYLLPARKR